MATSLPYRQLFFIEGRLLGEAHRKPVYFHEQLAPPPSLLWVCRICGEIYARAPVMFHDGSVNEFHVITRLCRKHKPRSMFDVPGSIWNSWDHDLLAVLPMPVLQWELERHLDAYEGINSNG